MFEFGRELRRLFGADSGLRPIQDGLTGGDSALLELLDLRMLHNEGKAADVAAGRIGAKDKAQRQLEAAVVWREVARRSGDAPALRKAAAIAEAAALGTDRVRRPDAWARARCEQAFCSLLGAELFGDDGLNAAAEIVFREARTVGRGGAAAALADVGLATVEARRGMAVGDAQAARAAAARFDAPILALNALVRRVPATRLVVAEAHAVRIDVLAGWGARLKDRDLLLMALDEARLSEEALDRNYEPLTWARAAALRGQVMSLLGEVTGEIETLADAVSTLAGAMDELPRDHSPLDWARAQVGLAQALQALADGTASERAYEQAVTCYDRANAVLKDVSGLALRASAQSNRALCLARSAELTGDLAVLDAAEAAFKIELASDQARRDPVGWALAQVNLARLYEARMEITGKDRGERAAAAMALSAAFDVFAEQGLRSFSVIAVEGLERLRAGTATPTRRSAV